MKKRTIIIISCIALIILINFIIKVYHRYNPAIRTNYNRNTYCDYKPKLYYEENGRKIYSYCLDKIEVKIDNNYIELSTYLQNHTIDEFLKQFKFDISYDDGGSAIYRDGGTTKYFRNNTTLIRCNKLGGTKDIYIGNKDMDFKSNFCLEDNSTTTYTFKVLNIEKYTKQQYNEEGTMVSFGNSYLTLLENENGNKEEVILNNIQNIPVKDRWYDFEFIMPKEEIDSSIKTLFNKAYLVEIRDITDNFINIKLITKLKNTNKIVIKNTNENKNIGTINDEQTIQKILNIIETSSKKGDAFTCDGTNLEFEFYNNKSLIYKMKVWTHNERIMFDSLEANCCCYYTVPKTKTILKQIIEENTGLKFYTIYDYTETCDTALEKIYEDEKYEYLFNCIKSNNVFIEFQATNEKLTLKEALNKKLITPETIIKDYPNLLIKRSKSN